MDNEGSLYDQFSGHKAPPIEQKPVRERTVGQFANRAPNDNKYNNKTIPAHAKESMRIEQPDESKMGFWRMFTSQNPKGSFEQSVNIRFGGREAIGNDFDGKKSEYIKLYKKLLGEYNEQ